MSIFFCFLEFKKFLQRKSNSMYKFEQPVILKVRMKRLKSPVMFTELHRPSSSWGRKIHKYIYIYLHVLRPSSTCSSWSSSSRSTARWPKLRRNTSWWGSCWTTVRSWRPCRSTHNAPRTSSSGPCRRSASTLHAVGLHVGQFVLGAAVRVRAGEVIPPRFWGSGENADQRRFRGRPRTLNRTTAPTGQKTWPPGCEIWKSGLFTFTVEFTLNIQISQNIKKLSYALLLWRIWSNKNMNYTPVFF